MVAALWPRCNHPLRAALIGKEMCGRIRRVRPHNLATREAREQLQSVEEIVELAPRDDPRAVVVDGRNEVAEVLGRHVRDGDAFVELGQQTLRPR